MDFINISEKKNTGVYSYFRFFSFLLVNLVNSTFNLFDFTLSPLVVGCFYVSFILTTHEWGSNECDDQVNAENKSPFRFSKI